MSASSEITDILRKNGNEAITFTWEQFYEITKRQRLRDAFLDGVSNALKKNDIHIIYGNSVVIVARDYRWAPVNI